MKTKLSPSMLSIDFGKVAEQLKLLLPTPEGPANTEILFSRAVRSASMPISFSALVQITAQPASRYISVFAGPSGVGKSSLINKAFPGLELNTGEISEKIQRGKHTTRHAELIQITEKSYIVDSPGFTSLYLTHIPSEKLQYHFREFPHLCR